MRLSDASHIPWHIETKVRSKRQHACEDQKNESKRTWQKKSTYNNMIFKDASSMFSGFETLEL